MKRERLLKVLLGPHISEKTTRVAERSNQIAFRVLVDATKPEIKRAVEELFDVKVADVCTLKVKGKTKRFQHMEGRRKNWKKAYVRLEEGYDIDFVAGSEA